MFNSKINFNLKETVNIMLNTLIWKRKTKRKLLIFEYLFLFLTPPGPHVHYFVFLYIPRCINTWISVSENMVEGVLDGNTKILKEYAKYFLPLDTYIFSPQWRIRGGQEGQCPPRTQSYYTFKICNWRVINIKKIFAVFFG